MGLLDVTTLKKSHYDDEKLGQNDQKSVPSQPQVRGKSGTVDWLEPLKDKGLEQSSQTKPKNAILEKNNTVNRNCICTGSAVCRGCKDAQEQLGVAHALR